MGRRGKKGLENKCTQDKERKESEKAKERPPTASLCPQAISNLVSVMVRCPLPEDYLLPPPTGRRLVGEPPTAHKGHCSLQCDSTTNSTGPCARCRSPHVHTSVPGFPCYKYHKHPVSLHAADQRFPLNWQPRDWDGVRAPRFKAGCVAKSKSKEVAAQSPPGTT